MTDAERDKLTLLLGDIDERTKATKDSIDKIERVQAEIFSKINKQQTQLDMLQQAHNDRVTSGEGCTQINMPAGTNPIPKWLITLSSSLGAVGLIALIIIIILLHKYGII